MNKYKLNEYLRQRSQNNVWIVANKYIDIIMNARGGLNNIDYIYELFSNNKNQFYAELLSRGYSKIINENLPEIFIWKTCDKTLNRLRKLGKDDFTSLYQLEYLIKKNIVA